MIYWETAAACLQPKYSFILAEEEECWCCKGLMLLLYHQGHPFLHILLSTNNLSKNARKCHYWIFSILLRKHLQGEGDCRKRGDNEGFSKAKKQQHLNAGKLKPLNSATRAWWGSVLQSTFQFISEVLDRDEVEALCGPVKFFQTKLGENVFMELNLWRQTVAPKLDDNNNNNLKRLSRRQLDFFRFLKTFLEWWLMWP